MSYAINYADLWRRAARYVDKILQGMQPGDLPVEQRTRPHCAPQVRSRIFLSHPSIDNAAAVALRDWLVGEGWAPRSLVECPFPAFAGIAFT
jgi:hypothetical protein